MTWDEICEAAEGTGYGDDELAAKDEARYQVRCLAMELGAPDLDEDERPEDWVESYCDAMKICFDDTGAIKKIQLPWWVENIIYNRRSDEYLKEDLKAMAKDLKHPKVTEFQLKQMISIYRHDEDSNNAVNDMLENVVREVLG